MYAYTFMKVRVVTTLSEAFRYERGVRQGCSTSPILFNIYINSLLDEIRSTKVSGIPMGLKGLLFADDRVLVADSKNDFIEKLARINDWMVEHRMEINPSKCELMIINLKYVIGKSPDQDEWNIKYDGESISLVKKYVYLGIEINDKLDLDGMARFRVVKGRGCLNKIESILRNLKIPLEYKVLLIRSLLIFTLTL